jgi:hypothetical protein
MARAAAVREVIARANRTMAASSARIEVRVDNAVVRAERPQRRRPGPAARMAGRAAWKKIAATRYAVELREAFLHPAAEGFIEPAAGRYMIDFGGYAEMSVDGQRFHGQSGQPLQPRFRDRRPPPLTEDPLALLAHLQGVTDAGYLGEEAVRGTRCQVVAVRAGSAEPPELRRTGPGDGTGGKRLVQEPERLSNHEGVVIDGKVRIIERGAHLSRVPEPLMPGPPFSDRAVALPLAHRMSQVNIAETDHPYCRRLDHRHSVPGGIDHGFPQARLGQRLAFMLVIGQQTGRGGLAAAQDRGDELIAERAGESKLHDRQVSGCHDGQPNEALERAAMIAAQVR